MFFFSNLESRTISYIWFSVKFIEEWPTFQTNVRNFIIVSHFPHIQHTTTPFDKNDFFFVVLSQRSPLLSTTNYPITTSGLLFCLIYVILFIWKIFHWNECLRLCPISIIVIMFVAKSWKFIIHVHLQRFSREYFTLIQREIFYLKIEIYQESRKIIIIKKPTNKNNKEWNSEGHGRYIFQMFVCFGTLFCSVHKLHENNNTILWIKGNNNNLALRFVAAACSLW